MANGKIKGKQIEDLSLSLDKLDGNGSVILGSSSQIQITGTAINPNDVITLKELDGVGQSLQVTDYLTGATFGNVDNIIFRGQTVTVPGGTATGVLAVNGQVSNSVVVWIPAPSYVDYFNTGVNLISDVSTTSRLVGDPLGFYDIGNWITSLGTPRDVRNSTTVSYTNTDFSVFDLTTTLDFNIYGSDGITTLATASIVVGTGSVSIDGLTINVTSFSVDQDRYKASVTFTADLTNISLIPNGGRFSIELIHNNSTDGTYIFTQNDIFYDSDGTTSNAIINGNVSSTELSTTIKWLSGIAYYDTGSSFTFLVTDIDNINDSSYPRGVSNNTNNSSGQQLRLTTNNFAISSTFWGHSSDFGGWLDDYNVQNLTYNTTGIINISNNYEPDFGTDNVVNTSSVSTITSNIYDWSLSDSQSSPDYKLLIDTYDDVTVYNNNPIIDESGRLPIGNLGTVSTWSSTSSLASDELQMIFGRVIYPQDDFSIYHPSINVTNNRDYSGSITSNKTFIVYTDVTTGSGSTSSVSINGYRWFATAYGKNSTYTTDFGNGIFDISSNFTESDLTHDQVSNGTGDLQILVGVDSTGANTTADRFLWISNDATVYPGRSNAVTYNLSGGTKQIQFSKGSLGFSVRRCWLIIGYNNSVNGIDLYLNDISFN